MVAGRAGAVREGTDPSRCKVAGTVSGDETTEISAVSVMSRDGGVLAGGVNRMEGVYRVIFVARVLFTAQVTVLAFNRAFLKRDVKCT